MNHPTERIAHTTAFITPVVEYWLEQEIAQWVHTCLSDTLSVTSWALSWTGVRSSSVVRVFAHGEMGRWIDPSWWSYSLSYFSFQPVLHDCCNKGHGMYYLVCGMMHIKEPLLLIEKSNPCSISGFPLSLFKWSFTICLMPYNRK